MIDPSGADGRERLAAALGIRRWVDEVAAGGPYADLDALVAAGEHAAAGMSDAELDEALAAVAPVASPGDRAGLDRSAEGDGAAIARGDEVYRQRFGRAFVIDPAGRSQQEVADELQRRLKNDEAEEAAETRTQLRRIAATRLATLFGEDA